MPATTPSAPTSLSATAGNGQASISFTAGADNGSAITNYSYSTDGGTSFSAFSPAQTTSPVTITGLTNGTLYNIKLKGVNAIGISTASSTVSVAPATTPSAPSALIATPGAASAVLNYTAGATGGSAITNYQYSTDGGTSFTAFSPVTTGNPLTITGLTNGTTYSLALKAVNAVGAGTASSTVSVTPNGACGPGVPLTTGTAGVGSLWQMLALPCVPTTSTIAGTFGTGTSSNLNTDTYASNTPTIDPYGWIIEKRTVGATPAYVPLLNRTDVLSVGEGYWLKSYQAPTNGTLTMEGTATPTDVTQAQGCYSANGCKAITVTTYTSVAGVAGNRYNLVGNPFPYNVEWSKVRIRVDGSASTLTPTQANAANIVSNTVNIWNDTGTGYNSLKDVAPSPATPNLQYFKSFWVNVLPGAAGHTVELLIPAEQSTLSYLQAAPDQLAQTATLESMPTFEMPWYLGWLDLVVSPAAAAPLPAVSDHVNPQKLPYLKDWYIRLKLDNPVTGWKDHGMLLGQLSDANLGFDRHDIAKMAPFTAPYLSLVFIHPDWGLKAADYASNFHPYSSTVDVWHFQIHADPVGSIVYLSWEGSPALLTRSRLIEVSTGKVILANDPLWKSKGYPITLTATVQDYIWRVLP